MAVRAPIPFSLNPSASSTSMLPTSTHSDSVRSPEPANQEFALYSSAYPESKTQAVIRRKSDASQSDQSPKTSQIQESTPHEAIYSAPSKFETSTDHTDHESHDRPDQNPAHEPHPNNETKQGLVSPTKTGSLKVNTTRSIAYDPSTTPDDEPPQSVIHAPLGFGNFVRDRAIRSSTAETPRQSTPASGPSTMSTSVISTASSESVASDITVTRLVGADTEPIDRPTHIPPLQTQLPLAHEWTKTPRAQTRRDLGVFSRPGSSLASLTSISEAEDDHPDHPTDMSADEVEDDEMRDGFYRNGDEDVRILQSALSECWTLCNTLASLSLIHREKIFSKRGNMQQQAWRSCWRLCQNLYEAKADITPMNVRVSLDLCREFCQALFDVRSRDDETADSVLRVSFELNNHLFNTHDRSLPEAFSERTLDFYITLCHRLMKQRLKLSEETGSLLRACWGLAEMLFSLRQTRRDGRKPDEDLLSSSIQACWELCDLFRDGWTQIRPERHTPRPAMTTLTQAFQQAQKANATAFTTTQVKVLPETPTTVFEDINAESPYEQPAPNIVVLGPGGEPADNTSVTSANLEANAHLQPRQMGYKWPSLNTTSSITTLSTTSDNSLNGSIQTVRSPSDDPNMALVKSMFVRAAMKTNRGFAPLAATTITTVSTQTSLPLFVKSLPEVAFGSQAWQMSLLDNFRKAVINDPTFRTLGVSANPTLLGIDGDEITQTKIKADSARAVQLIVTGTFGWTWLRDLFRFAFDGYVEDVINVETKPTS